MKNFLSNLTENLLTNLKMILLSFAIALVAWLFISVNIFPTVEVSISDISVTIQPTEYMQKNNLQMVNIPENLASIRLEGKRYDVSGLGASDFSAAMDLSSVKSAGTFSIPINVKGKTDGEYEIIDIEPQTVTIQIVEIITREFPVVATAPNISLPEGFYVDDPIPTPATISITGSASVLDKIDRIEARSKFSGIISESHDTQSDLFIYGTNGSIIVNEDIKLNTRAVSVNIPIYKKKELPLTFKFTNVPSNFDIDSIKYDIRPTSVTVAAPDDSIDNSNELVIATIDLADVKPESAVNIPIVLPENYKNLSGTNNARIEWKNTNYGKLDFAVSNISLINVPDNYDVKAVTNELVLSVIGPSDQVSTLSAEDFYVTANLLGVSLVDGSQNIPVSVMIKGTKQKCWVSGSYKVTVDAKAK